MKVPILLPVVICAMGLAQGASQPKKSVVKTGSSASYQITREFRKSAGLAHLAIKNFIGHVYNSDEADKYEEEADRAMVSADADAKTKADNRIYLGLQKYLLTVDKMRTLWLEDQVQESRQRLAETLGDTGDASSSQPGETNPKLIDLARDAAKCDLELMHALDENEYRKPTICAFITPTK